MKYKFNAALVAGALLIGASGAFAAGDHAQGGKTAAPGASVQASTAMTVGEVRKVDTEQGKVTIKHEAIANLEMPPMTMVFRASKPELLKDLKAGDKISFVAESKDGAIVVTQIQAAK